MEDKNKEQNPHLKPDTNQVHPKNFEKIEEEGKRSATQNKNSQIADEPDYEGEDEPQPYHDLQSDDPVKGPRDADNRH